MARRVVNRSFRPVVNSPTATTMTELTNLKTRSKQQSAQANQSLVDRGLTAMAKTKAINTANRLDEIARNATNQARATGQSPTDIIKNIAPQQQQEAVVRGTPQIRAAAAREEEERLQTILERKRAEEAEREAKLRLQRLQTSGLVSTGLTPEQFEAQKQKRAEQITKAKEEAVRASAIREAAGGQELVLGGDTRRGEKVRTPSHSKGGTDLSKRGAREQAIIDALIGEERATRRQRTASAISEAEESVAQVEREEEKAVQELEKQAEKQASPEGQAVLNETRRLQQKIKAGGVLQDFEQDLISRSIGIAEYRRRKSAFEKAEKKEVKPKKITKASIRDTYARGGVEALSPEERRFALSFMEDEPFVEEIETLEVDMTETDKGVKVEIVRYQTPTGIKRVPKDKESRFLDIAKKNNVTVTKLGD